MAITGTGTQADPYTFNPSSMTASEVWADFKTILAKGSSEYASLPANYILDFNDANDVISEQISISCGHIIGNGFTVKNLSSNGPLFNIANRFEIYDLNLLNCYAYRLLTLWDYYNSAPNVYFYGCVITGSFTTPYAVIGGDSDSWLYTNRNSVLFDESPYSRKGCGINIECANGSFISAAQKNNYCTINNSHVIFKGKSFTSGAHSAHAYIDSQGTHIPTVCCDIIKAKNSLIEGEFDYLYLASNSRANVINVDMDSTNGKMYAEGPSTSNIYNSDKAQLTYAQGTANITGVNNVQLKNARYLASIGFPIGADASG